MYSCYNLLYSPECAVPWCFPVCKSIHIITVKILPVALANSRIASFRLGHSKSMNSESSSWLQCGHLLVPDGRRGTFWNNYDLAMLGLESIPFHYPSDLVSNIRCEELRRSTVFTVILLALQATHQVFCVFFSTFCNLEFYRRYFSSRFRVYCSVDVTDSFIDVVLR